jgi:hypothetical protein
MEPVGTMTPQAGPVQPAPEAVQKTPLAGFEPATETKRDLKFAVAPALTEDGPLTENTKRLVSETGTEEFFDGSATLVAVMVTFAGEGRICGAVKRPAPVIVPQEAPEQPAPLTAHVTEEFGLPAE